MAAVATNTNGGLPASGARLGGSKHVFPPNSVAPNEGNVAVVATGRRSTSLSPKAHAAPANEEKEPLDPQTPNEETLAVQPTPPIGAAGGLLPDTTILPASNGPVQDALDPGQDLPVVLGPSDNEVFPSLEHGLEEFVPAAPAAADIQAQWMAYAKLEFEDGDFYMTTYAIELGRDITASRIAQRHELEERERQEREVQGLASVGDASYASIRASGEGSIGAYHSHVSESGGIVGRTDENTQHAPRRRKKGQKSRSTASSRQPSVANVSEHAEEAPLPLSDVFTISPVLDTLLPDPNKCPLIPIHPPEPDSSKGISRRHARIEYNSETRNFELTVLGKNGVFLDDVYYHQDEVVPLQDKSRVQIGKVNFNFRLPNYPAEDENEEEELGSISGRMSFAFEDGRGDSIVVPDDESEAESEVVARSIEPSFSNGWDYEEDSDEDGEEDENDDDDEVEEEEEEEVVSKQPVRLKLTLSGPTKKDSKQNKSRPNIKHVKKSSERPQAASKAPQKTQSKEQPKGKPKEKPKAKAAEKPKAQPKSQDKGKAKAEVDDEPKEASAEPKERSEKPKGKELEKPREPKEPKDPKDSSLENIRNEAQLNGEGITIPGLPPGVIIPPKRKGPGRPPKDGIMSKREKSLLVKRAKLEAQGLDAAKIEEMLAPKITKSKENKDGAQGESSGKRNGVEANGERKSGSPSSSTGGKSPGDKKAPKATKPALSPSPPMRIEDFTEEQLQRPPHNYVVMCYEVISESKTGALSLQQIYRAIQHKYPFYRFKQKTQGWQSSVRHNLSQNEIFEKTEKDGKGWMWAVKPGASIEKEKKKKASPPPQAPLPSGVQHPQYPHHVVQHGHPGPYSIPPHHGHGPYPGMPLYHNPPAPLAQPPPPRIPPSLNGVPPSLAANQGQTSAAYASPYVSPYGSGPPAHANQTTPRGPHHLQQPPHPPYPQHRPPYPSPLPNGASPHAALPNGQPSSQQPYTLHRPSPMPPPYNVAPRGSHTPPMPPPSHLANPSQAPSHLPNSPQPPPHSQSQAPPNNQAMSGNQPQPPRNDTNRPPWRDHVSHLQPSTVETLVDFREAFISSSIRHDSHQLIDNAITRLYVAPELHPTTTVEGEPGVMAAIRNLLNKSGNLQKADAVAGVAASSATNASAVGAGAVTDVTAAQAQAQAQPAHFYVSAPGATTPAIQTAVPVQQPQPSPSASPAALPTAQAQGLAQPAPRTAPTSPAAPTAEPLTPVSGTAHGNGNGNGAGAKRSADAIGASEETGDAKKAKI